MTTIKEFVEAASKRLKEEFAPLADALGPLTGGPVLRNGAPATMNASTPNYGVATMERVKSAVASKAAVEELKELDVSDLPRWKRALQQSRSSGYAAYFPFLLAHHRPGKRTMLVTEDSGSLCVFIRRDRKRGSHTDLFLNPIPMDVGVTRRCLERANDLNHDRTARILRIDGNDAALAAQIPGLELRERRKQYLYAPRAFGDLEGGKYRTLRYHVGRIRRMKGLEVVPYDEQYAPACRELLSRWAKYHRSMFGTSGDAGMSKRALALTTTLGAPDLIGELILLDGRLVSYAFGGEIRPGLGCLYEAKTDLAVTGLTYFQYYSFLSKLDPFELVNGGSDARRAGVGQLKDSLRPAAMHVEYRGNQVTT